MTDRLKTGLGDYVDVEANLTDVVKKGLRANDRINAKFANLTYVNANPTMVAIKHVPSMFIWCDGSDAESNVMGASIGRALSQKESFYATVQMVHSGADEYEESQFVKHVGSVVKDVVYENLNLNGMMNFDGELIEATFFPEPFEVQGTFKMMQGFKITVKFNKTQRRRRATTRR